MSHMAIARRLRQQPPVHLGTPNLRANHINQGCWSQGTSALVPNLFSLAARLITRRNLSGTKTKLRSHNLNLAFISTCCLLFCVLGAHAQTFRNIPSLNFSKAYEGANPLPQVIAFTSTGDPINFSISTLDSTGGHWLSINLPAHDEFGNYNTPDSATVSVAPSNTLAPGTYSAKIIAKSASATLTIPVSIQINSPSSSFFDDLPGGLTFSLIAKGIAPPEQLAQIRNAGSGTLSFTATTSTSDGGKWITLSATSGKAPYLLNVGINSKNLPEGGQSAGTFTGQVLLNTGNDKVSIPITVTVGAAIVQQLNPLSFIKLYDGANPLPQVITFASTGDPVNFSISTMDSTGGHWLSISLPAHDEFGNYNTPDSATVSIAPSNTLAPGTYSAQIVAKSTDGTLSEVIPVTLSVELPSTAVFDDVPGALTFSGVVNSTSISSLPLPIRNAGTGTLNWAATAITSDSGKWLSVYHTTGVAPTTPTIEINRINLPGKGSLAGTYTGQILLQSVAGTVTVPVTVTIENNVLVQVPPLSFSKAYDGTNPASKIIKFASTSDPINFSVTTTSSTGGNWLSITLPDHDEFGNYNTPDSGSVFVDADPNLLPGVYTATVYAISTDGSEPLVIPVTLTVDSSSATATPKFSVPGGSYSSSQAVAITDATIDAAIYYTTDGSTPTASSKVYSAPISVTATETIKAIAIAPDYHPSAVASVTYTLTGPVAAEPAATETIAIAESTSGVTVYYTTDGSTPTTASKKYTSPLALTSSSVLKFIAIGAGYSSSAVRTISTTIQ